jgi:hypothetical protein
LDCVWLVNDRGEYEQTVDQSAIGRYFEVLKRSRETDPFGVHRRQLPPLREPSAPRKRGLHSGHRPGATTILQLPPAGGATDNRRAAV